MILLTARAAEADRVVGLRLGADDYVVKPFSPAELAARVVAVLRRTGARPTTERPSLDFGELAIDLMSREVRLGGQLVEMTAKEFDLLAFFARSPRQVFTREQLLSRGVGLLLGVAGRRHGHRARPPHPPQDRGRPRQPPLGPDRPRRRLPLRALIGACATPLRTGLFRTGLFGLGPLPERARSGARSARFRSAVRRRRLPRPQHRPGPRSRAWRTRRPSWSGVNGLASRSASGQRVRPGAPRRKMARDEQHRQVRPPTPRRSASSTPLIPGMTTSVTSRSTDTERRDAASGQSGAGAAGVHHRVTAPVERGGRQATKLVLVLHQQHDLVAAGRAPRLDVQAVGGGISVDGGNARVKVVPRPGRCRPSPVHRPGRPWRARR